MSKIEQYPYQKRGISYETASYFPYLPITLYDQQQSLSVSGLLDTGASVNVLPYDLGVQLGAVWEEQTTSLSLGGNLSKFEARVLLVSARIGEFEPIKLAFAWTKEEKIPLILGQVNFFMEFDVCFFRSRLLFEITTKSLS